MADVTLHFNGRGYRLACAPGEEARLDMLAAALSARLEALVEQHGQVGDERLLLMAALQYADEAEDLRRLVETADRRSTSKGELRMSAKPEPRTRKGAAAAEVTRDAAPSALEPTPSGEER